MKHKVCDKVRVKIMFKSEIQLMLLFVIAILAIMLLVTSFWDVTNLIGFLICVIIGLLIYFKW